MAEDWRNGLMWVENNLAFLVEVPLKFNVDSSVVPRPVIFICENVSSVTWPVVFVVFPVGVSVETISVTLCTSWSVAFNEFAIVIAMVPFVVGVGTFTMSVAFVIDGLGVPASDTVIVEGS